MLSLNKLAFSVPKRQLLQPMSLQFATGCVTGLIGHNGSGKSTLLKLLAKQLKPSAGEVLLNGVSLQQWHSKAFAREVAHKVIFMADGEIVEQGTPQELFSNPQQARTKAFLQNML